MKQKILDELKTKIAKYVPKIMEKCDYCDGLGYRVESIENDYGLGEICDVECPSCHGTGLDKKKFRDITLEDVMIALSKKHGEWHTTFYGNNVIHIDNGIDWIPNKQLHEQELETLEFLNKEL